MNKKSKRNNKFSIADIKDLLKIFNKLTKRNKRNKRKNNKKIINEGNKNTLSGHSIQYFSKIDKLMGLIDDERKKQNERQIIIHNNPPNIIINKDIDKVHEGLNKLLEDNKINDEEYEKLKNGDRKTFSKVFNENPEFRKLLIDTHNREVKVIDRNKIEEELKNPETKEKIYNLKNSDEIQYAITEFSNIFRLI